MNIKNHSITSLLARLWDHFEPKHKKRFVFIVIVMFFSAFAEIFSIAAIVPFISVIMKPDLIFKYGYLTEIFSIETTEQAITLVTTLFIMAIFLASTARVLLAWATAHFAAQVGVELSTKMYSRSLHQPYMDHILGNSSTIISGLAAKVSQVIFGVVLPSIMFLSAVIIQIGLISVLVMINPLFAFVAFVGVGSLYVMVSWLANTVKNRNSSIVAAQLDLIVKVLNEGLGGIRDILINGTQDKFIERYNAAEHNMRHAQAQNAFIAIGPKFIIEAICVISIALYVFYISVSNSGSPSSIFPIISAFALGAQRMLPMMQQCYSTLTTIQGNRVSLNDVLNILDKKIPPYMINSDKPALSLKSVLSIDDVYFSYSDDTPNILDGVRLTIKKGERIGIIGSTGSGKSTLTDIIMGLLRPNAGVLNVDGVAITDENLRSWQRCIANVPQAIFLSDASVAHNIAFGVPDEEIDMDRVRNAARMAKIAETIEAMPDAYDSRVGERGVQLSGGQRQRIGIARALYRNASVIILDEATSALDTETEAAVMETINSFGEDVIVLAVAHRLSTLDQCDRILEMHGGKLRVRSLQTPDNEASLVSI